MTTPIDSATQTPIGSIGSIADAKAPETQGMGSIDKQAFLKLLVAQMRYQNPMQPVDSQQYLQQAAQMASVERLDGLAKAQAELVAYQQIVLSSSLVGREVKGVDQQSLEPVQGLVTSVRFRSGVPLLMVGDKEIPVGSVEEVMAHQATTSSTPASNVTSPTPASPAAATPASTPAATTPAGTGTGSSTTP
jgi:flagellar basal-body rod modification protein FlgD